MKKTKKNNKIFIYNYIIFKSLIIKKLKTHIHLLVFFNNNNHLDETNRNASKNSFKLI